MTYNGNALRRLIQHNKPKKGAPYAKTTMTETLEATTNAVAVNGSQVTLADAAALLTNAEVGAKDSNYLEMEPGEERRVVFLGWEDIDGMGDKAGTKVPACSFVTNEGKKQINADAVIVSYFQKQQEGCVRKIVCTGIKRSKGGFDYKTFDFYEIKLKKA